MQAHFFSLLLNPARDLWEFTKPVLIKHQHLERLEAYVSKLLETGRFPSRSAVLREAVRLVVEREQRLAALDATIARDRADLLKDVMEES